MPGLHGLIADNAVERGSDLGEGEVSLGAIERGLQFSARALRFRLLCLQDGERGTCAADRRPRARDGGIRAVAVGARLLDALGRRVEGAQQVGRAFEFGRRAKGVGLGGGELRARLLDQRRLRGNLRGDALDG